MQIRQISKRTVSASETIPIPQISKPIWAEIGIEKTIVGRAASFLFRTPIVTIRVQTADGRTNDFRLPVDLAAGGFLLSPVVTDRDAFAALVLESPENAPPPVTAIRILTAKRYFQQQIQVSLATVEFGDR